MTALHSQLLQAFDSSEDVSLKTVRDLIAAGNQHLEESFNRGEPAHTLVKQRSEFLDQILAGLWHKTGDLSSHGSLVAVGGYGRMELFPASDIDFLILIDSKTSCSELIEQYITLLWDTGLELGHSVRTIDQCVEEAHADVTVMTNLMEARLITGSEDLLADMVKAIGKAHIWNSRDFFKAKLKEYHNRHNKFDNAAYRLEPNIKDGPGGMRDIQTISWVAKREFGQGDLGSLIDNDFLTEDEHEVLRKGYDFLAKVRFAIHVLTKRHDDRLLFDRQQTLAKQFGYKDDTKYLAVEKFMKDYFRTVTTISRLTDMLLQHFEEVILFTSEDRINRINDLFVSHNDYIETANNHVFLDHPTALLEIFHILQRNSQLKGVRASTVRQIRNHLYLIDDNFRKNPACRKLFLDMLRHPRGITHVLRKMNLYGVLAAYIPAFGHIVGQMQYDLFHIYTVDEHTLMVLRNLRRFTIEKHAHEFTLCSEIINQLNKPELLYIAAIFHDLAKGRGGDHSQLGAADAREFCHDHGLCQADQDDVVWLVESHLLMSVTAQRKDISDPNIVREFAQTVGTIHRLDYLYLLTVADIRGTNPEIWNSWKNSLLAGLYRACHHVLTQDHGEELDQHAHIMTVKDNIHALLDDEIDHHLIDAVWQNFNDDYFLKYTEQDIIWHLHTVINTNKKDLPYIAIREDTQRACTALLIYALDQDYLFATTVAVLGQQGLTIVDARILTTTDGYTINTYHVLDRYGEQIKDPFQLEEIKKILKTRLTHITKEMSFVSRRLSRQHEQTQASLATDIIFSCDAKGRYTMLEITAADRANLLARICQAFVDNGIRVHSAKISTLGNRVEDIFHITNQKNKPLDNAELLNTLEQSIRTNIDKL